MNGHASSPRHKRLHLGTRLEREAGGMPRTGAQRPGERLRLTRNPARNDESHGVPEDPRFEFTDDEKQSFIEIILSKFHVVDPSTELEVVDNDPDDNRILECAVACDANHIVTGDPHLLELETHRDTEIVTPAEHLEKTEQHP